MDTSTRQGAVGFAGLQFLVTAPSDLDAELAAIELGATCEPNSPPATSSAAQTNFPQDNQPPKPGNNASWLIAGGVGLLLLWGVISSNDQSPTSYTKTTPRTPSGATSSISEPSERIPPATTNAILSEAEIRYCLFQNERLDAAKSIVDQYSEYQVSRFNALVTDYNSRCSKFRYRASTLERVRREIPAHRLELNLEGAALISTSR
jgi:hypothetical protein